MSNVHENDTAETEVLFKDAPVDEALYAYLFGDDEADPGPLLERFAADPTATTWLEGFERDYAYLKGHTDSPAIARARTLRAELAHRQAHPIDWTTARASTNVRSLDAARLRDTLKAAPTRRSQGFARIAIAGVLAATIAAAIFLVVSVQSATREVDVEMAKHLTSTIMDQSGHGFAGPPEPTPRERGFLLGAVMDLSRPRKATGQVSAAEVDLARELADRALDGLDAPESAEDRRQRLLGGCAAILVDPADRKACEEGLADYQRRRDAF
jgi:hypothetical protein